MTDRCATGELPSGAFTVTAAGWSYHGALTLDNATGVFEATQDLPLPDTGLVDFAGLEKADSAALAVIIELLRRANRESRGLTISHLPPSLSSLAQVYGIEGVVQSTQGASPETLDVRRRTPDADTDTDTDV